MGFLRKLKKKLKGVVKVAAVGAKLYGKVGGLVGAPGAGIVGKIGGGVSKLTERRARARPSAGPPTEGVPYPTPAHHYASGFRSRQGVRRKMLPPRWRLRRRSSRSSRSSRGGGGRGSFGRRRAA